MPPLRILYVTPERYDFNTATLVQGLNALSGIELKTTTSGNYAAANQVLSAGDAAAYGSQANLLVLGSNRGVNTDLFWSIVPSARNGQRTARIFIDGGDNSELALPLAQLRAIDLYF